MSNSPPEEESNEDPFVDHHPVAPQDAAEFESTVDDVENPFAENPYATPLEIGKDESVVPAVNVKTPWQGGWAVMLPLVVVTSIILLVVGNASQQPFIAIVLFPVLALLGLASVVRLLHDKVQIAWPGYLAMTTVFGIATYILFVPVCTVVIFPLAIMTMPAGMNGAFFGIVGFGLVLSILGAAFTGMLRIYLAGKYRKQVMHQIMSGEISEEELQ